MAGRGRYNTDGSLGDTLGNDYEIDLVGNWTMKAVSIEVYRSGKSYLEPTADTIRTITSYPWPLQSAKMVASVSDRPLTKRKSGEAMKVASPVFLEALGEWMG